jgi:molybdate transport system substrate-binding protein
VPISRPIDARRLVLVGCVLAALAACRRSDPEPVRVAAASDLTTAFEELGRSFEQQHKQKVSFTFGSSGLLAKQLSEGAPFDVFAAASIAFVDDVVAAGACEGATRAPYGRGRIVIWSQKGGVAAAQSLSDLADARFVRIAIANPEHAPYGKAAREALIEAGVWSRVEKRMVYGENIRQTWQLAQSGNVEAAIVALSLVIDDHANPWVSIDERLHRPIDQALVACNRGKNAAGGRAFATFVNGPKGRSVMKRYGFLLPNEAQASAP